jgi:hypothetical protein
MGSADPSSFIPMIELPPELFTQWLAAAINALAKMERAQPGTVAAIVAQKAAQWAADQKLEACCQLLDINGCPGEWIDMLRAAHRPKPLSLKQQALEAARIELDPEGKNGSLIIRALEALPDD